MTSAIVDIGSLHVPTFKVDKIKTVANKVALRTTNTCKTLLIKIEIDLVVGIIIGTRQIKIKLVLGIELIVVELLVKHALAKSELIILDSIARNSTDEMSSRIVVIII